MNAYSVNYDGQRMIYWEKNDDSAQYVIYLYLNAKGFYEHDSFRGQVLTAPAFLKSKRAEIKLNEVVNQIIDVITVPREKTYHTFSDLVHISSTRSYNSSTDTGLFYSCKVVAEDRNGNKIDESNEIRI